MVKTTVKQVGVQNGTSVEHQYPITTSTFILYRRNYSKLITYIVCNRKDRERKYINYIKSSDLECDSQTIK